MGLSAAPAGGLKSLKNRLYFFVYLLNRGLNLHKKNKITLEKTF